MDKIDLAIKIITALRPRFYNKLTWLIVFSGIGLMSSKLWEKLLTSILEQQFEISFGGENDTIWGFSLVIVGLVYNVITTSFFEFAHIQDQKKKKEKSLEHDKKLFKKVEGFISEQYLSDYLENLSTDHSYYTDQSHDLGKLCSEMKKAENQFLTPEIDSLMNTLSKDIKDLIHYCAINFYVFPREQKESPLRLCMHPHWNMDREGSGDPEQSKKYQKAAEELNQLIINVENAYSIFRSAIKQHLII